VGLFLVGLELNRRRIRVLVVVFHGGFNLGVSENSHQQTQTTNMFCFALKPKNTRKRLIKEQQ